MSPSNQNLRTRFAPSPTGYLHLGHAFSALLASDWAKAVDGQFLLRFDDIDGGRSRPEFETAIIEDLAWLGIEWADEPQRQSELVPDHQKSLEKFLSSGLTYPCFCTRKEIQTEIANSVSAPHGPDGPLYPGTCRHIPPLERKERKENGEAFAIRINANAAAKRLRHFDLDEEIDERLSIQSPVIFDPLLFGDFVLARKDIPASYHLACVVDDAKAAITHVIRGEDLFPSTHVHRLLQELLRLPAPTYAHHQLIADDQGNRLAKRHDALSIRQLRKDGITPQAIRDRLPQTGAIIDKIMQH